MASLSSPGIGSGLDVNGLVSQLVTAAKTPQQNQIDTRRNQVGAQLSAIGSLKSALSALQDSLTSLSNGSAFTKFLATASSTDHFSAVADSTAAAGTYSIDVEQLATAEKASSGAFASGTTLNTGALTISVGGQAMTIAVGSGTSSLSQLAGAINRNAQNPGVTAAVVHAADGDHIVLTSTKTGAANAFTVSGTGDVAGLSYDPSNGVTGLTPVTRAVDAKLSIDGFDVTSASNAVQGAIQGVTINLAAVSGGMPDTLTVAADNDSIRSSIQSFVDNYNKLVGTTRTLTSYDSGSGQAGALLGDSTMLGVTSRLSRALGSQVGATGDAVRSLADIGIKFELDGSLSLDDDKLSAALAATPDQVRNLFGTTSGLGQSLTPMLEGYLQTGGILDGRTDSLNQANQSLDDQQGALDTRMDALTAMYTAQFTKLDQLLTSLNSTSSFLTQQLANVTANNAK
ncbi:MAG TPA: flagellar filament capping protein FliD [Rhodanobacteraceae bacterium]|nr:flagellar filament capping protein FliD [Rhodanobacteraceae bacterium]